MKETVFVWGSYVEKKHGRISLTKSSRKFFCRYSDGMLQELDSLGEL